MLEVFVTEAFATWFRALDDATAEEIASMVETVERLGPERAPPESSELLTVFEEVAAGAPEEGSLRSKLKGWASVRSFGKRALAMLESERVSGRLAVAPEADAARALAAIRRLRRELDPRLGWGLSIQSRGSREAMEAAFEDAMAALGLSGMRVPAHDSGLRELVRRGPGRRHRILYGVDETRSRALVVLGEDFEPGLRLGESVRRAEATWRRYLEGGLEAAVKADLSR